MRSQESAAWTGKVGENNAGGEDGEGRGDEAVCRSTTVVPNCPTAATTSHNQTALPQLICNQVVTSAAAAILVLQPLQPALANELPSIALPPQTGSAKSFQQASVDVADAAYPVVKGLQARAVAPLASKAVSG